MVHWRAMEADSPNYRLRGLRLALLLWLVVLGAGLIVSGGHFHTADEVSMFVTAVNIVDRGQFHTDQLGWGEWAIRPGEEQGTVTAAGDVYSKKSPLLIFLMVPLAALGRLIPALGVVAAVLLLGPLISASTAALLFGLARAMGYSQRAAVVAALVYAFATMAIVFSKSVMRETIAGLALVAALWAVHAATKPSPEEQPRWMRFAPALGCGAGLAVMIGANPAYLSLSPVLAAAIVAARWRRIGWREQLAQLAALGLAPALMLALLAGYNDLRFGSLFDTGYSFVPGQEGFSSPLWWGVPGLVVSPARGLLWYNPTTWLAIGGWRRFTLQLPVQGWTVLAVAGLHLILFGSWWEWWGGYTWGPRFLLPLVPCLSLAALPIFESMLTPVGSRRIRLGVAGIVLLGVAVEVAGVVIDYNAYEIELDARFPAPPGRPLLYHHDPALVYDVLRSPILVHWSRLATSVPDFAWWPARPRTKSIPNIVSTIQSHQQPGDALVYLAPELLEPLMGARGLPPIYGLPVNIPSGDQLAQRLFSRAMRAAGRVWLVTWYGAGDPGDWYEAELRRSWASLSDDTTDGYRLVLFARPPEKAAAQPDAVEFGSIHLGAHVVSVQGDTLFVELHWNAVTALSQDYVTFVHVLNPDGTLMAGQDRQPLGGYQPTHTWRTGDEIVDRFAFALPSGQAVNAPVQVGWYTWPSLVHLPVTDSSGNRLAGDELTLRAQP